MSRFVVLFVVLAIAALPVGGNVYPTLKRFKQTVGIWHIRVVMDSFTGINSCKIVSNNRRLAVDPLALAVRPANRGDVGDALIRIDGGAAFAWRDTLPELARLGVEIDGRDMASPTDGKVWLPLQRLTGARTLWIQIAPHRHPRRFNIANFAQALSVARHAGCRDSDFVS
jgi:hypothetical protein